MKTPFALILALLALFVAGCGDDENNSASTNAGNTQEQPEDAESTGPTGIEEGEGDCSPQEQPPRKTVKVTKPKGALSTKKDHIATVKTSCGTFTIKLDVKRAPKTASSFAHLADERLFDKTFFHRIVTDFVIQGGDPLGNGTGDSGYKVVEEPPSSLTYDKGVVAMAKGGNEAPGTSSSQFFVVTGSQGEALPPEYALLGKVEDGLEVVEKIAAFANPDQTPSQIVIIESIRVK